MNRAYYAATSEQFLNDDSSLILGELTKNHQFALEDLQKNAWISQINILKNEITNLPGAHIAFEYAIPRMGKRVDTVIIYSGGIYVLEFKVGEKEYSKAAIEQVLDYSIDLKNFHEQSHSRNIIPIVVATEAAKEKLVINKYPDGVYFPVKSNQYNIASTILSVSNDIGSDQIDPCEWIDSIYKPTPTIIQAAQALYKGHSVKEISRSDSGAINLGATSNAISEIIEHSKRNNRKSICFITGVPGAGKTLAGLNIANQRHNVAEGEHAVFLSGNGPLVEVLREALARNEVSENKNTDNPVTKKQALTKTNAFIQNIHHFRDDNLQTNRPPIEKVAIFDEAQRAWTLEQTSSFMARKKGIKDFSMSEPEFLISVLDRHKDWAIIVCLVGGGQEINTGEAGLSEWFHAVQKNYHHWDVYVSDKLTENEYMAEKKNIYSLLPEEQLTIKNELHLSVSVRSYRSEKLSEFVKAFLDLEKEKARDLFKQISSVYPIAVTRNFESAKKWLKDRARGKEGIGVITSSGAYRLKPYGIHVKSKIDPKNWFLNSNDDVRSSGFLEDVATEFDIQGLELDWVCVAWDANLRLSKDKWEFKDFRGTNWQNINDEVRMRYLLNAYRVLLTRARQGMIVFIPEGNCDDVTRLSEFYDPLFNYFVDMCIDTL
jgi:hypothetical protein